MIWYSNFQCPPSFRTIQMIFPRSCRTSLPSGGRKTMLKLAAI